MTYMQGGMCVLCACPALPVIVACTGIRGPIWCKPAKSDTLHPRSTWQ